MLDMGNISNLIPDSIYNVLNEVLWVATQKNCMSSFARICTLEGHNSVGRCFVDFVNGKYQYHYYPISNFSVYFMRITCFFLF